MIKVLLVDSQPLFREGVRAALARQRHPITVVGEAGDGSAALEMARALHPDVVLIDVCMPVMDGITATTVLKAEYPDIHVLALTVLTDEDAVLGMIRAGASGYLLKDVGGDELATAVEAAHRGEVTIHPAIARKLFQELAAGGRPEHDQPAPDRLLTKRELQILRLLSLRLSNRELAERLVVSERTVENHLRNIYKKLAVEDRREAVRYASEHLRVPAG